MKRLLYLILFCSFIGYGQNKVIDLDDQTLDGQSSSYYLDTSSTAQTKAGHLQSDSQLRFANDSNYVFHSNNILYIVQNNDTVGWFDGGDFYVNRIIVDPNNIATQPKLTLGGDYDNEGFDNRGTSSIYFYNNNVYNWVMSANAFGGLTLNALWVSQNAATQTILGAYFYGDSNTGINHWGTDSIGLNAGNIQGINIGEGNGKILVIIWDTLNIRSDSGNVNIYVDSLVRFVTDKPEYLFNNRLRTDSIWTDLGGAWADNVLDKDYNLPTLKEKEKFIKKKGHLPYLQPINDGKKGAWNTELQRRNEGTVRNVEEIWLYLIEQDKKIENLTKIINKQQRQIKRLKKK